MVSFGSVTRNFFIDDMYTNDLLIKSYKIDKL